MGAVARAIKNMGIDGLILVRPNRERWLEAIKMAPGAEDILEDAPIYSCIEKALADMHYVIGTTRRIRKYRLQIFEPREAMADILRLPADHRVAIVFGSERNGLTNHELSFCQKVVVIPTNHTLPSINLAQAVMIMAYEWHIVRAVRGRKGAIQKWAFADGEQRQRLMDHAERVLKRIGFIQTDPNYIRLTLADLLSRLELTEREAALLRGILSRIEFCLDRKRNGE
jgi:tRNA (cytidine32/uridine32-2'-O)-methyltransferase